MKRVRHIARITHRESLSVKKERILKPQQDRCGYIHVRLRKDGEFKLFRVHILVGIAFLGYDPSQYDRHNVHSLVIDHLDGDKLNNRVDNLEVVTQLENIHRYLEKKRQEAYK